MPQFFIPLIVGAGAAVGVAVSTVVATAPVPSPAVVLTASDVSISKSALEYLDTKVTTAPATEVIQLGY